MPDEPQKEEGFVERMQESKDPFAPLHEEPGAADGGNAPAAAADDGKGDGGGNKPAATPNPEMDAIKERLTKAEERAFQAEQRATYFQGQVAREREPVKEDKPEAPKPFVFDKKVWQEKFETDGIQAAFELANEIADDKIRRRAAEIETNVDGKLGQRDRTEQMRTAFKADADKTAKEFGEYVATDKDGKPVNEAFDREAYDAAQEIARDRGAPRNRDGSYALSPGDLYSAASITFSRWSRAGKIKPKAEDSAESNNGNGRRSLRQIIDQVPQSDNLGNGNRNGSARNGIPKTIDDLVSVGHFSQKEGLAAKNFAKSMGWKEDTYVANILAAEKNGETDYK